MSETSVPSFSDLGLNPKLTEHLLSLNFLNPTPIQTKTIPTLLSSEKDFIGLAPTGTGKTAAFGLPLIERIDASQRKIQALVLSPTRELAIQVAQQLESFGYPQKIRVATIYGGGSYTTQRNQIRDGAQIVVATPGRLVDFLTQKEFNLENVETVILDEADEMVSRGFKEDLELILESTQSKAQPRIWLFSATMSSQVQKIANSYLTDTDRMEIKKDQTLSALLEQYYCAIPEKSKRAVLLRVIQSQKDFYGVIFCEMKHQASEIARFLADRGFSAEAIHGDRSQAERERTLGRFKKHQVKILVATDVAARGLDIQDLTHVINFTLPWQVDVYTHRVGRTARNGKTGIAISLVSEGEIRDMHRIQGALKIQLQKLEIPSQKNSIMNKFTDIQKDLLQILKSSTFIEKAKEILAESGFVEEFGDLEAEDILAALVVSKHKDLFYDDKFEQLSVDRKSGRSSGSEGGGQRRGRNGRGGGGRRRSFGEARFERGERRDDRRDDRGESSFGGGERREQRAEGRGSREFDGGSFERRERRGDRGERRERHGGGERREQRSEGRGGFKGHRKGGKFGGKSRTRH